MDIEGRQFVVLGGGISGCSVGWLLRALGANVRVVEKDGTCGGIARTFRLNGLPYEFGPHILHAKKQGTIDFYRKVDVRLCWP